MGNTGFKIELRFGICFVSVGSVDCPNMKVFSYMLENGKKHQLYVNLTFYLGHF